MEANQSSPLRYTPGPWAWHGDSLRQAIPDPDTAATHTIIDSAGQTYGFCWAKHDDVTQEMNGNKRLMEASPELFEALQTAERFMAGFEADESQEGISIKLAIIRAALGRVTEAA